MSPLVQAILTILGSILGSSGIMYFVMTKVVAHKMDKHYAEQDAREKLRDENLFLIMARVDNSAEMTHMMAVKLHDAGVINGDLHALDEKNKELNEKYNDHLRSLALRVLSR